MKRVSRRGVYLATIVAMVGLTAGFALASLVSTITPAGQNGFAVSNAAGTIYAGGTQTTNLVMIAPTSCDSGDSVTGAGTVANIWTDGGSGCVVGTPDWYEEVSFASGTISAAPTDHFTVTNAVGTTGPLTVSFAVSTGTVTTNVYYYLGASATTTAGDVVITGS